MLRRVRGSVRILPRGITLCRVQRDTEANTLASANYNDNGEATTL